MASTIMEIIEESHNRKRNPLTDLLGVLLDPNVIFVILVVGLWAVVTAIYLPGTGAIELAALAGVVLALFLLANMTTNWLAVVMIVLGVLSFLVLPLLDRRFLLLALIGLAVQGVGGWLLFPVNGVSLLVIVVVLFVSLLYTRFALIPTLRTQHDRPQMLDDQPLVGMLGYVQTIINPVGTVYVNGESWTARRAENISEPVEAGDQIVVRQREGLTLFVEPIKRKNDDEL